MPILRVTLPTGFTTEQKTALFTGLTQAAHRTLGAPLTNVRIALNEVPAENLAHAGERIQVHPATIAGTDA
jgi:4-oxalocrotonate tautomerase family enzyme